MPRKLSFLCFSQIFFLVHSVDNADDEDNFFEQEGISFTNTIQLCYEISGVQSLLNSLIFALKFPNIFQMLIKTPELPTYFELGDSWLL